MVEMVLQQEVQQGGLMVGGWGERGGKRVRSIEGKRGNAYWYYITSCSIRFFSSLHGMFFFVYHRMMLMSTFISTFFIFIINNR